MPFDDNKLYCSEILSILLQNHDGKYVAVKLIFVLTISLQTFILYSVLCIHTVCELFLFILHLLVHHCNMLCVNYFSSLCHLLMHYFVVV